MAIHGFPGGVISATAPTTSPSGASGVWTLNEQLQAGANWPVTPALTNRSLRLRSSASAYLNRTFALGNRKTWTFSAWVKRGILGAQQNILHAYDGSADNRAAIRFNSTDTLAFDTGGASGSFGATITTAVFRDPSAWYHIVCTLDTTQATAANRQRVWVNGVQQTLTVTATVAQNYDGQINLNVSHQISSTNGSSPFLDGYLTEVNFIDGQALTPNYFGATNPSTGAWQPATYRGTYGTNGFYLPFTNITSTSTLGNDFSGNGNNWTTNNISLTAGATYDSMTDVPTNTNATTANYAVMNPLDNLGATVTNGNLQVTSSGASWKTTRSTFDMPSGSWYCEMTSTVGTGNGNSAFGIVPVNVTLPQPIGEGSATSWSYSSNGNIYNNGSIINNTGATWSAGTTIALAFDGSTLRFYRAGTLVATVTSIPANTYAVATSFFDNNAGAVNFGQRPFANTPPTGFVALNTFNLPTPTIGATASTQAGKNFNIVTYTGDQTTGRAITGVGFQPDFVWAKARNNAQNHTLYNSVVGATKFLCSNTTNSEFTNTETLQSFNADGFTLGNAFTNETAYTYVAWNWKANGTGVSNTAGSITSTVSANTSAGFSVVTYTGNGSSGTVGHGLGVTPRMIIVKSRSTVQRWTVFHASISNAYIYLNETLAADTGNAQLRFGNNTVVVQPTSTSFSIGNSVDVNQNTTTYVAYCFSEVAGYSRFGSFTGNGSSDGPFTYTGFRPRYVMWKRTNTSGDGWWIIDSARSPENVADDVLLANLSNSESVQTTPIDFLSNGFKMRNGADGSINANGSTYIFMAFAETPFNYANAR